VNRKVIIDPHFRRMDEIFSPAARKRLAATVDVVWGQNEPMPADAFRDELRHSVAVVTADWRHGDVLDEAEELRAILTVSGGWLPEIDYAHCFERGIRVLSAAPAFAEAVAEMALALALACSRDVVAGDRAMRHGTEAWLEDGAAESFLLRRTRVGFVGFGNIGRALLDLLTPFRCEVVAYDPWLTDAYVRSQGVKPVELDRLLRESRVIFVLASPNTENRALLSRDRLESIRPGSVLVLVSRAHVIDFDALTELVLADRFKAAVDVFPAEPLPADHPIRTASSAVLSAHRAGAVQEALREIGDRVIDDLEAIVRGLAPRRLQAAEPEIVTRYVRTTTLVVGANAPESS
jgi:phosphoglycerate dehydrogenase-like enzyme